MRPAPPELLRDFIGGFVQARRTEATARKVIARKETDGLHHAFAGKD